jgi:hypothetical protein
MFSAVVLSSAKLVSALALYAAMGLGACYSDEPPAAYAQAAPPPPTPP